MTGSVVNGKLKKKKKLADKSVRSPEQSPKQMNKKIKLNGITKISGGGNGEGHSNNDVGGCLEGMTSAELSMVRKLAGNDPVVRKKTLRKLRKWLTVLAQRVPDNLEEARIKVEPNFIRVWKALFYCMWMADKPLPQEQLAESISDLQNIFAGKTAPFLLFVEWFIRTIAREWSWIDRFRMDKFMMLFRRFLRKSLLVMQTRKWANEMLEGYLKLISVHIFNRKPAVSKKALKGGLKQLPETNAPLGLQVHFTDIFMEELAKVGGGDEEEGEGTLKWAKILKILRVFMYELGYSGDDRLLEEIRERIFNQLMRQSDVGIDWQEEMMGVGGDLEMEEEEDGEGDEEQDELEGGLQEDEFDEEASGELDPRAGAVDVVLPQLQVDYGKLVEKLVEFGGQKEVKLKNRRILYGLASQFREITEGKYPLAVQEDPELNKPAVTRKEVKRKVKELMEEEERRLGGEVGKGRKSKKQRRKEIRRLRMLEQLPIAESGAHGEMNESQGSEDNSKYIQDEELLEHVTDNYMSYLEEGMEGKEDEDRGDEVDSKVVDEKKDTSSKKSPKKRKWKTEVEVEEEEEPENVQEAPEPAPVEKNQVILVKRPRKRLSLGSGSPKLPTTPVLKGKTRRLTEILRTPLGEGSKGPALTSTPGSASKRVSFVLNRNLEHEHADYPVSIARSPQIPYDKLKKPSYGLLKTPPASSNGTPITKRHQALDFF